MLPWLNVASRVLTPVVAATVDFGFSAFLLSNTNFWLVANKVDGCARLFLAFNMNMGLEW